MTKQKPAHKKPNKSLLAKLKTRRSKWIIFLLFIATIISIGLYSIKHEDLPVSLPPPPADAIYRQSSQSTEARVQDLISRMTLEEKIGQMALVDKNSLGAIEDISKYNLGGVLSGAGAKPKENTPAGWQDMINGMKSQATKSRLNIPILYGVDANHGHANVIGATIFPHAIGLGATGDPELVKQIATITSDELASTGVNWNYTPSLDAPKDIRWGRVYEAFSDSPETNAKLGAAYITGTQSPLSNQTFIIGSAKHYLATGAMQWGKSNHKKFKIDQGKTAIDEVALKTEYLPPYKAAVNSGVASVMVGLNQWGDQRIIDSKYLVTDKLKNELGFKGFVVSDWYGVYEYSGTSKYNSNIKTINAGLDMAMLPYDYKEFIKDVSKAVKAGSISQDRIDDAVERILTQKFKSGLFDAPIEATALDNLGSAEHRKLARKAVSASAVLLKNDNSVLPLQNDYKHILVAGSGADNVGRQSGAWTVEWQGIDGNWLPGVTSVLQGIKQKLSSSQQITYELDGNFKSISSKADIGIAVVSEKPYAEGWGDNANPSIDTKDLAAIENLKKSSEKVIVIILSGRPLMVTEQIATWDGAVAAWLPGSEGGGVADVLFGDVPFTGKLPITWPANLQQLPVKSDGTTKNGTPPLFPRGYGL